MTTNRLIALIAVLLALLALPTAVPAAARRLPAAAQPAEPVRDQYIVLLKADAVPAALLRAHAITARFAFQSLNGFVARLTPAQLASLRRDPAVALIEPDRLLGPPMLGQTQADGQAGIMAVPWNLDRIDQRSLPLSGTFSTVSTGSLANVYIVGSGIKTSLPDFVGRAFVAYDALGGNGQDCEGSGTYMAGLVGGATYGVAKGARLWSVRVADCNGYGTAANLVKALDWLRINRQPRAIALIATSHGNSAAVDVVLNNLLNSNVFVVVPVSAGTTACAGLATKPTLLTVGLFDRADKTTTPGSCIDVYAPGDLVTSNGLTGTLTPTRTVLAGAPHAAGVAALYKSTYGDHTPATIHSWIVSNATPSTSPLQPMPLLYTGGL